MPIKHALVSVISDNPAYDVSSGEWNAEHTGGDHALSQGRLTLTTAVPVTTSDVTAATTLYFTPYKGNLIGTYSGSVWSINAFTEQSITLASLTAALPYDVFIVDSTLALELLPWTNGTTRATALVMQDGILCKTGALTRRYLGTICIAATGQCEDSLLKRLVWNYYNRTLRKLKVVDTTDSWVYSTNTWRSWNNSAANRVQMVIGVSEDAVDLFFGGLLSNGSGNSMNIGIGLDSTSVNSADILPSAGSAGAGAHARYVGYPGVGSHFLQLLEIASAAGTGTFFGDLGVTWSQGGGVGSLFA